MKYRDGYNDGAQGKPPRYSLGLGTSTPVKKRWKSWLPIALSFPNASAIATVVGASRDPPANEALAEGQSEACLQGETFKAKGFETSTGLKLKDW